MAEPKVIPLETYIAGQFTEASDDLVDEWIEDLQRSIGIHPSRFLPAGELRRDQGFDVEEIVIEFEKLTRHVFSWRRTPAGRPIRCTSRTSPAAWGRRWRTG